MRLCCIAAMHMGHTNEMPYPKSYAVCGKFWRSQQSRRTETVTKLKICVVDCSSESAAAGYG